jgi:hypothetical protein
VLEDVAEEKLVVEVGRIGKVDERVSKEEPEGLPELLPPPTP